MVAKHACCCDPTVDCSATGNAIRLDGSMTCAGVFYPDALGINRGALGSTLLEFDTTKPAIVGAGTKQQSFTEVLSEIIDFENQCEGAEVIPPATSGPVPLPCTVSGVWDTTAERFTQIYFRFDSGWSGTELHFGAAWNGTTEEYDVTVYSNLLTGGSGVSITVELAAGAEETGCAVRIVVVGFRSHSETKDCGTGGPTFVFDPALSLAFDAILSLVDTSGTPCDPEGEVVHVWGLARMQGAGYHSAAGSGDVEQWAFGDDETFDFLCPGGGSPLCDDTYADGAGYAQVDMEIPISVPMDGVGLCGNTPPTRTLNGTLTIYAVMDAFGHWDGYIEFVVAATGSAASPMELAAGFSFSWNGSSYDTSLPYINMIGSFFPEEVVNQDLAGKATQDPDSCALTLTFSGLYQAYASEAHCPGGDDFLATWGTAPYVTVVIAVEPSGGFTV